MDKVFQAYIQELHRYKTLCESLFSMLEKSVTIKEGSYGDFTIKPTQKSILAEILYFDQDIAPKSYLGLPPHVWVEPSRGQVEFNGEVWRFNFHGMGLSFGQGDSVDNWKDVSVEFSKIGKFAATEWTTHLFFQTNCRDLPEYQIFINYRREFFLQSIENNYLIPIESLMPGDDQTYDFSNTLL